MRNVSKYKNGFSSLILMVMDSKNALTFAPNCNAAIETVCYLFNLKL